MKTCLKLSASNGFSNAFVDNYPEDYAKTASDHGLLLNPSTTNVILTREKVNTG